MTEETSSTLRPEELAKLEAETASALATARKLHAEADRAEILASEARILHDRELARDEYRHVYQFGDAVSASSVRTCIATLSSWSRLAPECDIEIVFTSPGGSVLDGMNLWDFIAGLRGKGHKVTTVARGYAASMAAILLQAGDVRAMGRESYLLLHEISTGTSGKIGDIEDELVFIRKVSDRVLDIFAARSTMTRTQVKSRMARKDWWLSSDEALKLGLVDVVI